MAESSRQERSEQLQTEQEQTQQPQADQSHPLAEPASLPSPPEPASMGQQPSVQQLTPQQPPPPGASPSPLEQQTGVAYSEGLSTFVRRLFVSFVLSFKGIGVLF